MKILFLDVDGVLNTRVGSLDADKVALLREIVAATGCGIVVSSSWRKFSHLRARLDGLLTQIGAPLVGMTPVLDRLEGGLWVSPARTVEIQEWLKGNATTGPFVILDDDQIEGLLAARTVRTLSYRGLTPELAAEVVRKFGGEPTRQTVPALGESGPL